MPGHGPSRRHHHSQDQLENTNARAHTHTHFGFRLSVTIGNPVAVAVSEDEPRPAYSPTCGAEAYILKVVILEDVIGSVRAPKPHPQYTIRRGVIRQR